MRWEVEYVEDEAAKGWVSMSGKLCEVEPTHMMENRNHWVPTWMTPATVSRQSRALWSQSVGHEWGHSRIGAGPTHIEATTFDYGLLHDDPVRTNEINLTVETRGKPERTC
jgi:hypothetical protein